MVMSVAVVTAVMVEIASGKPVIATAEAAIVPAKQVAGSARTDVATETGRTRKPAVSTERTSGETAITADRRTGKCAPAADRGAREGTPAAH
jgi:hypothetical protein